MSTIRQAFKKRILEYPEKYKPTYQVSYMENEDGMETEFTVNSSSTAENDLQELWNDFCKDNGLKKNSVVAIVCVGQIADESKFSSGNVQN